MTELRYPSDDFPAQVGVSLDRPDGWSPLPHVGLPLAIAQDVPEGQFRPNVVVLISRLRTGQGLEQAVGELLSSLTGLEGYAELGREEITVDGAPGFRVEASYRDPNGGTLVQAVRLAVVDRGPVSDLLQVTGTCAGEQAKGVWPTIRAIQESVRISR